MDTRNLILAIVLSAAIMFGWELFFAERPAPPPEAQRQGEEAQTPAGAPLRPATAPGVDVPTPPGVPTPLAAAPADTTGRLARSVTGPRVRIASPRLHGSIALTGGRVDDLTLAEYREALDPASPEIVLLSPQGAAHAYFADFGWVPDGPVEVPGPETLWTADRKVLDPGNPVTLTWDNGAGLRFSKTFALDDNYMFTVTQRVENTSGRPVTLYHYGLASRTGTPEVTPFFILHEGLLGVFEGKLEEVDYDDLQEAVFTPEGGPPQTGVMKQSTTGGWIGITDKYWLVSLVPDQGTHVQSRFTYRKENDTDKYQVDFLGPARAAAPGAAMESTSRLFAGAKEAILLDGYTDALGIVLFDRAIDFGWFWFLTKPIFYALVHLNRYVGNFGISILLLTISIKLVFFPLANKSYRAMSKMKKLQPEMLKLRERFGDDKTRLNQEMMALYKRAKANPASGCLPMVIQIPVFFALYKVLFVTIEMRHAPFFGWIKDLSAPDPTTMFNLFGLLPFVPPDFLMIGVWPLIMGATMFLQQRLNPQPTDPIQAKVFMFLPIVFTVLLAPFPAGLVIYWAWNNVLSILQQWVIMKRMGAT